MKLSVACNWDPALPAALAGLPVYSLYGKLGSDVTGGGRASFLLPSPDRRQAAAFVKDARRRGLKFNYLLNGTCFGGETERARASRAAGAYLDWVLSLKPDAVTVAAPWLLKLVKRRAPKLKVTVSALATAATPQAARFWEDLGADSVVLPEDVNRDFRLLAALRAAVRCDLQLIANMTCLYNCPMQAYHAGVISHSSQSGHFTRGFCVDYCMMSCVRRKISSPEELVKSRWIRPEDLKVYEELGYGHFKLIERYDATATLARAARAYAARRYDGNLLDILNAKTVTSKQLPIQLRLVYRPDFARVLRLRDSLSALYLPEQALDNRKLDGFLDYFRNFDCRTADCRKCGYCARVAKRAYRADPGAARRNLAALEAKLEDFLSGELFRGVGEDEKKKRGV